MTTTPLLTLARHRSITLWIWVSLLAFAVAEPASATAEAAGPDTVGLAAQLSRQGDHDGASRLYVEFRRGRNDEAMPVELWRGLAGSLLFSGQAAAAQEAIDQGLARYPTDAALLRISAGIYSSQGQYARAIEQLQQATDMDAGNSADHANLGGLLTNLGRYDEAEVALKAAAGLAPQDVLVQRRLGALLLKRHTYVPATAHLQRAVHSDPDSPTLACLLGQSLEGEGRLDVALQHYERAVALDPSYLDAHYRIAQISRRLGRGGRADSALAAFQRLDGMGDADTSKRFRLLRDAIMESGDQPEHVFALAKFLFDHGLLDESENRLQAAIAQRPDDFQAINLLGSIYLRRRMPAQALTQYERATILAPQFAPAALNAGNASMLLKQPGRALAFYERALALAPEVAMTWYGVGSAYVELGQYENAARVLQQGLERTEPEGRTRKPSSHN